MKLILRAEPNENKELEVTRVTFKSKTQGPLVMVIKEYWSNGEVVNARVLWSTKTPIWNIKRVVRYRFHLVMWNIQDKINKLMLRTGRKTYLDIENNW